MNFPKELYRADGAYRVCWGVEEYAKLKAEGWSDVRLCFSLYFPWDGDDAFPPKPTPTESPEDVTEVPVRRGPGRPRKVQE